jgi:hypothetical protein
MSCIPTAHYPLGPNQLDLRIDADITEPSSPMLVSDSGTQRLRSTRNGRCSCPKAAVREDDSRQSQTVIPPVARPMTA